MDAFDGLRRSLWTRGGLLDALTSSRHFANCTLFTELVNTVSLLDLLTDTLTFRARWCCRRIRGRHESPSTDCSHPLTFDIRGGNLRTGRNEMCGAITTIEQQVGVGSQDLQPMRGCGLGQLCDPLVVNVGEKYGIEISWPRWNDVPLIGGYPRNRVLHSLDHGCALPASPVELDLKGEFIKVAVWTKKYSHRRAVWKFEGARNPWRADG